MELRHLRYFVAVAEEQNITRAAARLRVSQPPLSRQIRDLEDELGVELLHRGAHSIKLSDAGRLFLTEARAVLLRAEEALAALRVFANGGKGELHVGYAPSLTVNLLPAALRSFQAECPGVRVHLHDLSTADLLSGVREGKLDLALMVRPQATAARGIRYVLLQSYPVCVAAHPTHPLARSRSIKLADVKKERLIAYTRKDYPEYHVWMEKLYAGANPEIAEEHDSVTSLIAAVESGRGVALVSQSLSCLAGPRLKLRPLRPSPAPMSVGAAYRDGKLTESTSRFLAAVKAAAQT
jgi:LysR family transcriptional regulator, benzoate and cis,cis-muconate-responsive activator of ben and cat genes